MRVRNAKRIITILLSIVSALLFSILISNSINVYKQSTPAKVLNTSATYSFAGSGTADNPYKIGSYDDLVAFGSAVNNYDFIYQENSGTPYIYVELTNDINCGGESIAPIGHIDKTITQNTWESKEHAYFNGEFDGKNHTISNLKIVGTGYKSSHTYIASEARDIYYSKGLFACLDKFELRNLKLSNVSCYKEYESHSWTYYYYYAAPLFVDCTNTTVTNCWVDTISGDYTSGFGDNSCAIMYNSNGTVPTITNCMLTNSSWGYRIDVTNSVYIGTNESPFTGGSSNCINSPKEPVGWSCSSIGGSDKSEVWYYSEYYNDGYPMLRSFMSWDEVVFSSNDITLDETTNTITTVYIPIINSGYKNYVSGTSGFNVLCKNIYIDGTKREFDYPGLENVGMLLSKDATGTEKIGTIKTGNSNLTEDTLLIFNQSVKLKAKDGHYIKDCVLSAHWKRTNVGSISFITPDYWKIEITSGLKDYTVTFNNVSGTDSGDVISPTSPDVTASNDGIITFTLKYGSTIIPNISKAKGPCDIVYTITNKDASETKYTITYSIPEKYNIIFVNRYTINENTKITPNATIKGFNIKFEQADNTTLKWENNNDGTSGNTSSGWTFYSVDYGKSVTSSVNLTNNTLQFTSPSNITLTYTPNEGFKLEKVDITVGTNETTEITDLSTLKSALEEALTDITNNITIQPYYARFYSITFKTIGNTTSPTVDKTISIKSGTTITKRLSSNGRTLAFYNGNTMVASYYSSKYYIMNEYKDNRLTNISSDLTITPTTEFYACTVTMGTISSTYGTRTVTGDNYETANDGIFVVEYGTTVNFKVEQNSGVFKYTYKFGSGQVVTYTMKNENYAMQYKINQNRRIAIWNGLNLTFNTDSFTFSTGTTSKNISPTFGNKQMLVTLKSDANTNVTSDVYWVVNYASKITYTNSNNTNITFANVKSQTYIPNTGFKLNNLTITGTSLSGGDSKTLTQEDLSSVEYDLVIQPTYKKVNTITFETIENSTLSTTVNPIEIWTGDSITRELTDYKKLEYKYNNNVVATYTANQYFRIYADENVLTNISSDLTITPTTEFYACTVTMGVTGADDVNPASSLIELVSQTNTNDSKTYQLKNAGNVVLCNITVTGDNYETANDGIFVVEYGTTVNFNIEQNSGVFTYTYTFRTGQTTTHTITYTITNDQYAMQYKLNSKGDRTQIQNGLGGVYENMNNGKIQNLTYTFSIGETSKTIKPTFGRKQYNVSLD